MPKIKRKFDNDSTGVLSEAPGKKLAASLDEQEVEIPFDSITAIEPVMYKKGVLIGYDERGYFYSSKQNSTDDGIKQIKTESKSMLRLLAVPESKLSDVMDILNVEDSVVGYSLFSDGSAAEATFEVEVYQNFRVEDDQVVLETDSDLENDDSGNDSAEDCLSSNNGILGNLVNSDLTGTQESPDDFNHTLDELCHGIVDNCDIEQLESNCNSLGADDFYRNLDELCRGIEGNCDIRELESYFDSPCKGPSA